MELIKTADDRITKLVSYLELLGRKKAGKEAYDDYSAVLMTATAWEVNAALHLVLAHASNVEDWKIPVSRFIRACGSSLDSAQIPLYPDDHLLARLDKVNTEISLFLETLQKKAIELKSDPAVFPDLITYIDNTDLFTSHYVSLQNELFPLFEKTTEHYSCVSLMWAIQDDILSLRKKVLQCSQPDASFWKIFGEFFLNAGALVYREKRILFPVAFRSIPDTVKLSTQKLDTAFSFISKTGSLDTETLEQIFAILPLDIAFIGNDDRVKFYSDPPHRIFPRSPAVIGRLVQNCHPPKSVSAVEDILKDFKSGKKDSEEFWLSMKNQFVHITYFALRSDSGEYMGTLEVTQDATNLRNLEGEKRIT